jgi:hypothetical protein
VRKLIGIGVLSLSLCLIAPCSAGLIVASGAGPLPATAEDLTALFPTEIVGTLSGTDLNDVSMFKIFNMQPTNFSSLTVLVGAGGIPDTVLTLFDSTGVGIYLNDDISAANTMSCLPSAGVGNPCPTTGTALAPGFYYLAISRAANYPVDGSSIEIFAPGSSTDLVGPSSTSPVAGWDGGAFTTSNFDLISYDIILTGTVPEPATWLLIAGAGLVFGLLRRRRD